MLETDRAFVTRGFSQDCELMELPLSRLQEEGPGHSNISSSDDFYENVIHIFIGTQIPGIQTQSLWKGVLRRRK